MPSEPIQHVEPETVAATPTKLAADYERGYRAGLEEAARLVVCAPVLLHGERRADVPGGVPRVLDSAMSPDGDPDYVHCTYALRDAVLHWLGERGALIDGSPDA